jgi:UPF0716 protein FxsA
MFALIAIFIFVPIAELYVIFKVGDTIGWLPTLAILAADSILGTLLMRSQGRAVWQRFQAAVQAGRTPHREVIDGALVIFGGAFLITPGFLTDVIGILLLLPPTRAVIRRLLIRRGGRLLGFTAGTRRGAGPPPAADWDVEGNAVEHEPRRLEP